ncbi:glycosyltransferase family 2 protein [Maritimibacter alkaliphilus]|uniref:glycosyltransferase family 2 protein n=1 Tax=Maritimibacter alkaliphilus TaxID=404236 RepID=UPI001C953498|nr:glycosyltransferase [Maritimibacter alkaliphilus]MBY6090580.1 glycosyltransferase [Maritimibacter alkaliphilus]
MSDLPVSVVVVSRGRPERLKSCLGGLSYLFHDCYEIIVVADTAGLTAVAETGLAEEIKTVHFDEANISAARNLGIAQAAGEIVAFIDDDAVPEPMWLAHLAAPFARPEVGAAGGFVRGRNGITFQYRARSVDGTGQARPLEVDPRQPTLLRPAQGRAIKTEGTNMAVRRDVLARIGGFDPSYRFYLDETDLNMRLARRDTVTAIVPLAEVHHAYAPSLRRRADRAPRDLFEKAASQAVYLGRYCPQDRHGDLWQAMRREERDNALRHMVAGRLEPREVRALMASFDAGREEGAARQPVRMPAIPHAREGFRLFSSRAQGSAVLSARTWRSGPTMSEARRRAAEGQNVSVFLFSRTALYHQVRSPAPGIWVQSGGLWGRSERSAPLFGLRSFSARTSAECRRVALQRGIG